MAEEKNSTVSRRPQRPGYTSWQLLLLTSPAHQIPTADHWVRSALAEPGA